jgi:hypothetical protein
MDLAPVEIRTRVHVIHLTVRLLTPGGLKYARTLLYIDLRADIPLVSGKTLPDALEASLDISKLLRLVGSLGYCSISYFFRLQGEVSDSHQHPLLTTRTRIRS